MSSRANTATPTFTMDAPCRYADTGVGASMAEGSHMYSGSWADLPQAANSTHSSTNAFHQPSSCAIADTSNVPVCTNSAPAATYSPMEAMCVRMSAFMADLRAVGVS